MTVQVTVHSVCLKASNPLPPSRACAFPVCSNVCVCVCVQIHNSLAVAFSIEFYKLLFSGSTVRKVRPVVGSPPPPHPSLPSLALAAPPCTIVLAVPALRLGMFKDTTLGLFAASGL
jgi:hypothetical protein